jgi:hypothetical protein
MVKSLVRYEVVRDVPGYPFDPLGFQSSSLQDAKRELKRVNTRQLGAYLAKVVYSRYEGTKKGR